MKAQLSADYLINEGLNELDATVDDPLCVLLDAQALLVADGIDHQRSPINSIGALLTAEAVNWAAKTIDWWYYSLKPYVVEAAAHLPNIESGWGQDSCFYLYTEGAGTAAFHDPYNQINVGGCWLFPWSRVSRQELAFDLLRDDELLLQIAFSTQPGMIVEMEEDNETN